MKNDVLCDVTPCGACKNRRFGGTSVIARTTQRHIPEADFLRLSLFTSVIQFQVPLRFRHKTLIYTFTQVSFNKHLVDTLSD
jgi:hypothetical protein